jgi:hypothetical protein
MFELDTLEPPEFVTVWCMPSQSDKLFATCWVMGETNHVGLPFTAKVRFLRANFDRHDAAWKRFNPAFQQPPVKYVITKFKSIGTDIYEMVSMTTDDGRVIPF